MSNFYVYLFTDRMYSEELLNRKCFTFDLKFDSAGILRISIGKEFHNLGAAYLKVQRP